MGDLVAINDFVNDWTHLQKTNNPLFCAQSCVFENNRQTAAAQFGYFTLKGEQYPVQELTLFDIGAITRYFTFYATNNVIKKLSLPATAPVQSVQPEFSGLRPIRGEPVQRVDLSTVTIAQLLRHTSGLPETIQLDDKDDRESVLRKIYVSPFESAPGTRTRKSIIGYTLLGVVLETLTGRPLSLVFSDQILNEIPLVETGFRPLMRGSVAALPIPREGIAPTFSLDNPKEMRIGVTSDPLCAKLSGVSGESGLFSTAHEVAAGGAFLLRKIMKKEFSPADPLSFLEPSRRAQPSDWHVFLSRTGCILLTNTTSETVFALLSNGGEDAETCFLDGWRERFRNSHLLPTVL